jgi:uncharacterized protein YbbC (DUF1343 family)
MHGQDVAARLNQQNIAGVRFVASDFIPVSELYAGQRCGGVAIRITDKHAVRSMTMGMQIAAALRELYPEQFHVAKTLVLIGNAETVQRLEEGASVEQLVSGWKSDLESFEKMRRKYFLYH